MRAALLLLPLLGCIAPPTTVGVTTAYGRIGGGNNGRPWLGNESGEAYWLGPYLEWNIGAMANHRDLVEALRRVEAARLRDAREAAAAAEAAEKARARDARAAELAAARRLENPVPVIIHAAPPAEGPPPAPPETSSEKIAAAVVAILSALSGIVYGLLRFLRRGSSVSTPSEAPSDSGGSEED